MGLLKHIKEMVQYVKHVILPKSSQLYFVFLSISLALKNSFSVLWQKRLEETRRRRGGVDSSC
jgi:ABC-type microcin C transport system permease subunit YejB